MATMYALLFGLLLNAVCSVKGSGNSDVKHQTFLLAQAASGSYFFSAKKYAKNSSLKTFDTKEVPPPAIVKNFVGDTESEYRDNDSFNSKLEKDDLQNVFLTLHCPRPSFKVSASGNFKDDLQSVFLRASQPRPNERAGAYRNFKDDLLAYGIKGLKAANYSSVALALDKDFQSKGWDSVVETLETAMVALRSHDEHRLNSLDFFVLFDQAKRTKPSGYKDYKRIKILDIASKELGVKEATNNNDGPRVEQYLRYTNLGPGYEWCAAFVSWCYAQAGFTEPRNPWSPALFPNARKYHVVESIQRADLFAIYGVFAKRINHVGLVKGKQGDYILTIEGNSNNRVESRRRHVRTIYAYANWIDVND